MPTVTVHTAEGLGIPGVTITVGSGNQAITTDRSGAATVPTSESPLTLTLTAPNYVQQTVTIVTNSSGVVTWDDPAAVVSGTGARMTVNVPLGRMAPAPTVAATNDELCKKILPLPADVATRLQKNKQRAETYIVPLQHTFTVEDGEYAFLFGGKENFSAVTELRMLGDPDKPGWPALYGVSPHPRVPTLEGSFRWLEWGPATSTAPRLNRYLAGLWRPRTGYLSGARPQDVIVFYTPTTMTKNFPADQAPFRRNYPYALNGVTKGDGTFEPLLAQRYIALGFRYLFKERWLAYQQLAARRDALLIVPIQPAAQWEDFHNIEGVQRLVLEAILFEHRQRRGQPDLGPDVPDSEALQEALSRGPVLAQHLPPPRLGTVCIAGFSAGVGAVKNLMQGELSFKAKTRTWADELANPYRADPTSLIASWKEAWDIDAPPWVYGSVASWAKFLRTWQDSGRRSDRVARCYHSTSQRWGPNDPDRMRPVTGPPTVSEDKSGTIASRKAARAVGRHGNSGSAVWFSDTYLAGNGPPPGWNKDADAPPYWEHDSHAVMPVVCFAHAAANSRLQSL